ncbi:hypothetical protein GMSM_20380 [Geomonas sp. Red276]
MEIIDCSRERSAPADAARERADGERSNQKGGGEPEVSRLLDELSRANLHLREQIDEHRRAEGSLRSAYADLKAVKGRLLADNLLLQQEIAQSHNFYELIGGGSAMAAVMAGIEQVAALQAPVLLRGEAGTGKGLAARAIHGKSARWNRPLVVVDLATMPANLVESELFGWESGGWACPGSTEIGRLEMADAGTVLLEAIEELSWEQQGKLLRLLKDGELERLGGTAALKVDVRVIAASSRDLEQEVRLGRFREELLSRLAIFSLTLPPLRERTEDIPLLVEHFLAKYTKYSGGKVATVPDATLNALKKCPWSGNVRELERAVELALITSQGGELRFPFLPGGAAGSGGGGTREEIDTLAEMERYHILRVLQITGWRIEGDEGASGVLGVNPGTLRARMRKYGIRRPCMGDR